MPRPRLKQLALLGIAAQAMAVLITFPLWLSRQRRWGATAEEVARPMPGDEIIPDPNYTTTRAVTVDAPPDCIYPWLLQMGHGRGGLYSYDFLDRLFGILDEPSAERIHPEWQNLHVGDVIPLKSGKPFPVAILEQDRAFVLADLEVGYTWQTCMFPQPDGSTRLVTRNRGGFPASLGWRFWMFWLDIAAFVMVRRWLIVLKGRAETLHREREYAAAEELLLSLVGANRERP
ncbi:MAG TPA: hypothetical protein VFY90_05340 [Tepidiformaceae bacterium]|nr:hypothetical protein [Tepidiformaceae bacterium]